MRLCFRRTGKCHPNQLLQSGLWTYCACIASDALEAWDQKERDGQIAYIEVISQEEMELFPNGRLLGFASNSKENSYTTKFSTPYKPSRLLVIAYSANKGRWRCTLRSADFAILKTVNKEIEHVVAGSGISLAGAVQPRGNIEMNNDDSLTIEVRSDATLSGLGSTCNKNL
ncbi:hypothetical protein OPT61_g9063 [Boeremia exigua]|uniref:Uncharacterized protein n=1 Tax=Boeremia exigua TaxID=749465 RepID=A0ACC2HVN3_9PLEO|nr:hypothetical protein OPT61_g9063 [Boeremia exigua]